MRGKNIGIVVLILAASCTSPDEESRYIGLEVGGEHPTDVALGPDTASDIEIASQEPSSLRGACYWSGWQCGVASCPDGFHVHGIDFNAVQSEGCWGAGNNYDEPFRRIECCDADFATHDGCYWTGWGCGAVQCAPGYYTAGVNFNAVQSEGCWGAGNNYDEPERQLRCCNSDQSASSCYWTGWGCGNMQCAPGYYTAGVDFNAVQSEGCWGAGNNYDEPERRLYCCT